MGNYYTGKVVNKYTKNPICHIAVTDGKNIVFTDKDGNYELPGWEKSNTISVSVLTKNHDDWYIYTGGESGIYNFEIEPITIDTDDFKILHLSDSEIEGLDPEDWLAFTREKIAQDSPAFLIHTGDIAREEAMGRHYKLMNCDTMGCPVRYVIGNHDYTEGDYGEQLYEKLYGPVWCSFDAGNIHCVILPMGRGDKPAGYTKEEALEWFKKDMELVAKGRPVIIFHHTHAQSGYDLKENHVIAWILGHYHYHYHYEMDGVAHICTSCPDTGGIDSSAAGIRMVHIQGERISSQMKYYRKREAQAKDQTKWTCKLDGRGSNAELVYCDGDVLVATQDDDYPKQCGIYRIDGRTGEVKWSFLTTNGIKNNFATDENNVYVMDCGGYLCALDLLNGEVKLEKQLELNRPNYNCSNVLLVEDTLFIWNNFSLLALDKNTFHEKWRVTRDRNIATTARLVYDEKRNAVIVSSQWSCLFAVDAATGGINWESKERCIWFRNATPTVCGDLIYTGGWSIASCLDANTGMLLKNQPLPTSMNVCGPPAMDGDLIYYPTAAGGVRSLDADTLEEKAVYATDATLLYTAPYVRGEAQTVESSPIVLEEYLIFTALDGALYIYKKDTAELVKKISIGAPVLVKPLIVEKQIYVVDFEGNLSMFDMA